MPGLMDELLTILEEQSENYSNLLGLSLEKTEVIVHNQLEGLQKITSLENSIVGKTQKLEKKRLQLIEDIAIVLNINPKDLTLSKLAELHKGRSEYERLRTSSTDIKETLEKLKVANEHNKVLIQNSLDYIDFSMNLIRSSSQAPSYYMPGGEEMVNGEAFFDAKQ